MLTDRNMEPLFFLDHPSISAAFQACDSGHDGGPHDSEAVLTLCCVSEDDNENREADVSAGRFVRYQFTPAFLKLRTVGAT